jgi:predicted RNase H-like HicB family nuclease
LIVSCPNFKGCHSYGYTIEEAMDNIQEAIELCMEETNEEEINKYVEIRELNLPLNV